ncbi:hypothetical protein SAMN06295912_1529 [Sphingomonas laterariae]|uniref:Secreted protein n=1 Tax=Edaphosphingomonas laterariae TaxID=861865 RepID=A0A239KI56_9SPHN|nr:hypothetical protein [Sphingomonas laterariae]SNT17368.1 hypothetical protein SAMN06295912_1529 [Sphingomonas laterariae]
MSKALSSILALALFTPLIACGDDTPAENASAANISAGPNEPEIEELPSDGLSAPHNMIADQESANGAPAPEPH